MTREFAHNPRRQYRRQCEREGLITKSGRQWRKFRKMMQRMAKEDVSAEVLASIKRSVEDMKAGRWTEIDPETLIVDDETPVPDEMFPVLEHPDLDPSFSETTPLEPGDDPTIL